MYLLGFGRAIERWCWWCWRLEWRRRQQVQKLARPRSDGSVVAKFQNSASQPKCRAKTGQGSVPGWRGPSSGSDPTPRDAWRGARWRELPRPSTNWALKRPETEPGEGTRRGGTGDAPSQHRGGHGDGSSVVLICCDGRGSPVAFRPAWGRDWTGRGRSASGASSRLLLLPLSSLGLCLWRL